MVTAPDWAVTVLPLTRALPATTRKVTGSPEEAEALRVSVWPATALIGAWKLIVWLRRPIVTEALPLATEPASFVATTS
jgi:hypothetical protein